MTEKRQTSQGYIIRILQHFATKLRNITNFVMLLHDEIFVQAYLDQKFTHKGKGLFVATYILQQKLNKFHSGSVFFKLEVFLF